VIYCQEQGEHPAERAKQECMLKDAWQPM